MGVVVEVIDAIGVEEACAPHQTVDFVPLREQELGKIGAVLPGNAGDQCACCHLLQHYRTSIAKSFRNLSSETSLEAPLVLID
jgi:hypothetical protein